MISYVPAGGHGVTFHVIAYPVLEFLCLPSTLAPCSGDILPPTKKERSRETMEIKLSSRPADFTGRFAVSLFYLACFEAVLGHMRFFIQEVFSRPDFPLLGMTHYSRFQRSNCNSCLGSSNCFELHTIWINQYGINKGLLFCNLLLKFAGVISGDITFPCLAFDYSTNTSPLFNWSFLVECNRNLF